LSTVATKWRTKPLVSRKEATAFFPSSSLSAAATRPSASFRAGSAASGWARASTRFCGPVATGAGAGASAGRSGGGGALAADGAGGGSFCRDHRHQPKAAARITTTTTTKVQTEDSRAGLKSAGSLSGMVESSFESRALHAVHWKPRRRLVP